MATRDVHSENYSRTCTPKSYSRSPVVLPWFPRGSPTGHHGRTTGDNSESYSWFPRGSPTHFSALLFWALRFFPFSGSLPPLSVIILVMVAKKSLASWRRKLRAQRRSFKGPGVL